MNTKPNQLLVIDPQVEDYQQLAAGIQPGVELLILEKDRDGIEQITEYLSSPPPSPSLGEGTGVRANPYTTLHIISHGSPGRIYLGNTTLELNNIDQHRPQLQQWGISHLYIYGCSVAAGDAGAEFLQKLHQITQANIAASNTLTGNAAKGGNWELQQLLPPAPLPPCTPAPLPLSPHILHTYPGILGASDLDTSFDTDGKVTTPILSGHDYGLAATIDSSGKILVAGQTFNGSNNDFGLARYNSDGSLDTSFGTSGKVTTPILSSSDYGNAITIDSNGKILVAGSAHNGSNLDFALARYNSDGSLDTTFGTGGKVTTDILSGTDDGRAMTIDSSGKILVAGDAHNGSNYDFALARYNSDGSLDTTFGTGGKVTTDILSDTDYGRAITIDSSGKILVAGHTYNSSSNWDFALARYNSDGSLDTTFGTSGKVTTPIGSSTDYGNAITIDSSGKILVAGSANNGSNFDFALARYNSNGSLDTTFGTGGKVTTDFASGSDYGYGITIDNSGKILVAGEAYNGSNNDFALAWYNSNGSLDTTFGTGGKVTTPILSGEDYGRAITIDSSGKILVAGYANNGSNFDFALVRYGIADIAVTTPAVTAATVGPSNTNQLLYQINLAVTEVGTTLTGLTLATGGTYQTTDVSNFKLWYSTDSTFNATTDTQLSTLTPVASGSNLAFTGLTQAISQNTTGYLFITTDIAASASNARTISLAAPSLTNITFDSATKTGTPTASNSLTIDALAPTVTLSSASATTTNAPFSVTANFSEAVSNFIASDISITNGTVSGFSGSGSTYTFTVNPTSQGTVTVNVPAGVANDTANNGNTAATALTRIYDTVAPTVTINQAGGQTDPAPTSAINYTVTFSEPVTGFDTSDITLGGTAGATTATVTGSGTTYNVAVSGMTTSGTVIPTINANAATDTAGNNSTASTSTDNTVTYNTIPTVSNIAKTGNEDNNITFTAADFTNAFTDVDNDSLNKIKITSLPANGTLQLGGINVALNQEILLASIPNLTFTPTADYNGSSSFTWNGSDGSNYATTNATANLTINPVNDQPSFTATTPATVNEDAGVQTISNWATFNPGPPDEASQTATYIISNISNPGLFTATPTVDSSGTLTYTPATDAFGTSTFDVAVQDNGGTTNGGVNTSTVQTFTITVNSVNDAPSFSNAGNQTLTNWTNTAQTVTGWANTFVFGPTNENTQTVADFLVTVTSGNTLFTTLPDIANDGTLTYTPSGAPGPATVSVQLKDDGGIANSGNDTSAAATFTIIIPPPTVELSVNTTTGTEAGTTAITLTATAAGPVFNNQTLNLALTGTADNTDFSSIIPAQITIADGSSSGQVTLTVANDLIDEDDETATLTISNPSAGIQLGTTTSQTITITDDDTAGYDITPISGDTSEFASLATFDISLTSQPTADVTLNFTSSDTTEGTVIPSVTFNALNWNIPQTVTITGVDDALADNNITYNINSTATSTDPKYNNNNPNPVTVTNTDNDIPGVTVIQTGGNTELTEGSITDSYTIQLNTLPTGNVQITATAAAQTEISLDGVSFAPTQTLTFTNANGMMPQTVTVRAINDTIPEDNHSGNITHAISNTADTNYPTTMTVGDVNPNITDNDISYTLTGSSTTVTEGNSGTQQITYNITRAGAINETSNVNFNFSGTAANTIDYNLVSITGTGVTTSGSTITFAPNATISTITVEVVGDQIDEDDETLEINLVNPTATGTPSVIGSPATTTITDDDTAGFIINPTSGLTTTEAGGTATFTVKLNSQPTANVAINLSSSNTAEGTIDKPTVTFTALNWNTPQTVTINGVDELVDDGNIAYNIITAPAISTDAKYNGMDAADVAVTNINNDTAGVTITQTGGNTQLIEGSITDTYSIALNTLPTGNVQITATADAQTQVSLDGVNFAASQTLTFTPANGMTPRTITVRAIDDNTTENLHSGSITNAITNSADTNYATTMALDGITGNITDNDISYSLTGGNTNITEGNSGTQQLTYNITRTGALNETSRVDFHFSGSATNIADYKLVSVTGTGVTTTNSTITFAPNATSATITVEVVGEQIDEEDETLEINLVNPTATGTATVIGSPVTSTIIDDDTAGFTVTPTSGLTTTEAGGTATFTVALNSQPTADVTLNLSSDNMAEGILDKPTVIFNAANWNTPQTVTVAGVDDLAADGDIAYNIITAAATSTDTKYNGINPVDVAVTNTDNDTAGVSLSTESLSVYEGGNASYSIVLNSAPTTPVTINFTTDSQLIALPPITFDMFNWNHPQTVMVTAVDDAVAAVNPTSIITHTITSGDANYNGVNVGTVAATITDNDTAGLLVMLPVGSGDVIEGGRADIYKLMLTQPPTADVVVNISGDSQLTVDTPSITFTPFNWNQEQVWRVAAVDDAIVEGGHQGNISFDLTSADGIYNQVVVPPLSIDIADNDNVGMETSLSTASGVAGTDTDDKIVGSSGADLVYGRGGTNQLDGGAGDDILYGGDGADNIMGGSGLDQILGHAESDYLDGGGDDDVIFGGGGNDRMFGGSGNDLLSGDDGNDYLFGDEGVDTLTGGLGRDAFAVGNGSGGMTLEMADVITDFVIGEDVIDLIPSLVFGDLSIGQNGADAVIQNVVTGEFLAVLQGVDAASLSQVNFG